MQLSLCALFVSQMSSEKPPQNYVELKTNQMLDTDKKKDNFKKYARVSIYAELQPLCTPLHVSRYKQMKWWAQSFFVGVPKVICGFRDDKGIVKNLRPYKTADLPPDTKVGKCRYCTVNIKRPLIRLYYTIKSTCFLLH